MIRLLLVLFCLFAAVYALFHVPFNGALPGHRRRLVLTALHHSSPGQRMPRRLGQSAEIWGSLPKSLLLPMLALASRPVQVDAVGPGETNEIVATVNGIRHKRLGGGKIVVSELGLGTQRWVSEDLNSPNEKECFDMMNSAILNSGVTLIDTASQYPIPSSSRNPEGRTEEVIGSWIKANKARDKVQISTKIVGSSHVSKRNILADCDASLKRLQTDYIDIYLLHWPARYSPQSNWGQSLMYHKDAEKYYAGHASFEEIVSAMGQLIKAGKIRGYGFCNDNCFGLTAAHYVAKALGVDPPVCLQGDYSLLDRKSEENGVSEASSSIHTNAGFMAYNVLAGGQLTGKYLSQGQGGNVFSKLFSKRNGQWTDPAMANSFRGRFDESGWGRTLYRYRSGPAVEATKAYSKLAKDYGIPGGLTELALRWTKQQQFVTTTLLGTSNLPQLEENLGYWTKTPDSLPRDLIFEIDRVHMMNRNPIFSSTGPYSEYGDAGLIGERIP